MDVSIKFPKGTKQARSARRMKEAILWAANSIHMEVEATDAPSPLAWSYLSEARSSQQFRRQLLTGLVPKVLALPQARGNLRDGGEDEPESPKEDLTYEDLVRENRET